MAIPTWKTIAGPSFNAPTGSIANAFTNIGEGFRDTAAALFGLRDIENEYITNKQLDEALRNKKVGPLSSRADAAQIWEAHLGQRKADDDSDYTRAQTRESGLRSDQMAFLQSPEQRALQARQDAQNLAKGELDMILEQKRIQNETAQVGIARAQESRLSAAASREERAAAARGGVDAFLVGQRNNVETRLREQFLPAFMEELNQLDITPAEKEQRIFDYLQVLGEEADSRIDTQSEQLTMNWLADKGYSYADIAGSRYGSQIAALDAETARVTAEGLKKSQKLDARSESVWNEAASGGNFGGIKVDPKTGAFSVAEDDDSVRKTGPTKAYLTSIFEGFTPDEDDVKRADIVKEIVDNNGEAFEFVMQNAKRKGFFGGKFVDWNEVEKSARQFKLNLSTWGTQQLEAYRTSGRAPRLRPTDPITRLRGEVLDQNYVPPAPEAPQADPVARSNAQIEDFWDSYVAP